MGSTIVKNGNIYPMDDSNNPLKNFLVVDGIIKSVNINEDELQFQDLEVINLEGKTCLPSFHDSHMHMISYGLNSKYGVDLSKARSIKEVQELLKRYILENKIPEKSWVIGFGWNHENFIEARMLTKEDLDAVSTKHYIFAKRVCIHIATVNSNLLELCGVNKTLYKDEPNIGKQAGGELDGLIYEAAISDIILVRKPPLSLEEIENIILNTATSLKEVGIGAVHTDDMKAFSDFNSKINIMKAYDNLRKKGLLPIRIFQQLQVTDLEELKRLISYIKDIKQDDMFSYSTVKLILDGSIGASTAALSKPYIGTIDQYGLLNYKDEELIEILEYCDKKCLQIMCHAIGDRAIEQITKVLEIKKWQNLINFRPRIVHFQFGRKDLLERLKKLNVVVDIQPTFATSDYKLIEERISNLNDYLLYAWRTMLDYGLKISGSSDSPVEKFAPLLGIRAAITRTDIEGNPKGGWIDKEKLSRYDAVKLYTFGGPYAVSAEKKFGKIEQGYYGDIVILGENIFEKDENSLHQIKVCDVRIAENL